MANQDNMPEALRSACVTKRLDIVHGEGLGGTPKMPSHDDMR